MTALQHVLVFASAVLTLVWLVRSGEFHPWYTRLLRIFYPSYQFHCQVEKGYEDVEEIFKNNFALGKEVGASVSVFSNGKQVVELYGGFKNFEKKVLYDSETLQLVYSSSKVLESVAVARLVDQGYLKYEDKISSIWPEFAINNKEDVTVEDLLRHEAGVTYFSDPQPTFDDLLDDARRSKVLENQAHLWGGKKVRSYHALNRGWYLNEVVRRVHPKKYTLGKIYEMEINPLLNIEFHLGLTEEKMHRRSTWYNCPIFDLLALILLPSFILGPKSVTKFKKEIFYRGNPFYNINKLRSLVKNFENGEEIHRAEMPSCNGFTNAYSLAKVASCLANGGTLENAVLITKDGISRAIDDCIEEYDTCLLTNTTMSRAGFGVFTFPELEDGIKFYGWPGLGGSLVLFNPDYNFSFSYVMNGAGLSLITGGRAKELLISAFNSHLRVSCQGH